ncbi:DEAD/DEAH box helicase [Desulfoferrobacter suflitae]|uniref:DEAD/DEAH box helicase n=1 Tax=Desulfoferrobacter suflitae TaxID=2865782 RepID=UPI0021642AE2|nr:DEAD/DEAH box helicase family protein [Desulfoferrobacter suflitae]MCK8603870.1 hypothetical protein [Desulfoferrobacter suflitae]
MKIKPLNILLTEWIKIPSEGLPPLLERKIHERLVFTNPDYELRHNRGEWIGSIPPQINCLRQRGRNYLLPRGFLDQFLELCKKFQQPYRIIDKRRSFDPVPIEFHGGLKSYQQEAAETALERDFATLVGGHKSGKTVISLYVLSQRQQPTLILIPRMDLLEGWLTKIENFLQIPRSEVGVFTRGNHRIGKWITIAHTGEMMRFWRKIHDRIGNLILDECQRCPSKVFTHLIPNFDTRYMLGLSNTMQRKDRLSRLIYYYVGDVVYSINEKDAREGRGVIGAQVVARPTAFDYPYQSRTDYFPMLQALMSNAERTRLIVDDIQAELDRQQGPLLVLSGGDEQNAALGAELGRRGIETFTYEVEDIVDEEAEEQSDEQASLRCPENIPQGRVTILLTPKTLAQCADKLNSQVLFLAVPIYFRKHLAHTIRDLYQNGTGTQGRLKIYDYVDQHIGLLENYFRMRSYNYGVHPDVLLNPN